MENSEVKKGKWLERRLKIWSRADPYIILLLGAAFSYGLTQYSNRLRVLNYYVYSTSSLFPKPDLLGKKLEITLDDKPIENLSSTTVFIFGSDQDLENIPINLRFLPVDGQPAKVIQVRPNLTPERYRETPLPEIGDGSVRRGYVIGVWNRETLMQFDCLFEGTTPPEVSVDTMAKGVVMQQRAITSPIVISSYGDRLALALTVLFGAGAIVFLLIKLLDLVSKMLKRKNEKGAAAMQTPSEPRSSEID
jgi:hypothetical protein